MFTVSFCGVFTDVGPISRYMSSSERILIVCFRTRFSGFLAKRRDFLAAASFNACFVNRHFVNGGFGCNCLTRQSQSTVTTRKE